MVIQVDNSRISFDFQTQLVNGQVTYSSECHAELAADLNRLRTFQKEVNRRVRDHKAAVEKLLEALLHAQPGTQTGAESTVNAPNEPGSIGGVATGTVADEPMHVDSNNSETESISTHKEEAGRLNDFPIGGAELPRIDSPGLYPIPAGNSDSHIFDEADMNSETAAQDIRGAQGTPGSVGIKSPVQLSTRSESTRAVIGPAAPSGRTRSGRAGGRRLDQSANVESLNDAATKFNRAILYSRRKFKPIVAWSGRNTGSVASPFPANLADLENLSVDAMLEFLAFYGITDSNNSSRAGILRKVRKVLGHAR